MSQGQLRGPDYAELSDSEIRVWGTFQWKLGILEFQLLTSKDPIQTPHMTEGCREGYTSSTIREWESRRIRSLTWKINPDVSWILVFLFVTWPGFN